MHGESLAVDYLQRQGYEILSRNWRHPPLGEIDIVARDGDCLAFVEVKTRRSRTFGTPEEAIIPSKRNRLLLLAQAYLSEEIGTQDVCWRVDAVAVEISSRGQVERIALYRNAVEA
jgi:putative endonuclease